MKTKSSSYFPVAVLVAILAATGCTSTRPPAVPEKLSKQAQLPALPGVRLVMDPMTTKPQEIDAWLQSAVPHARRKSGPLNLLALSGGGAYGAYGAGVLCGWTPTGARPEFDIVAGISTGALMAPYAFLGTNCDAELKRAYTTLTDKDVFRKRNLISILAGADSAADSAPLYKSLLKRFDDAKLAAIAAEHRKGRRLYVGTTDLDAEVLMCWDMGAIAASGQRELFCRVLVASASIPVAFQPQFFEVEADGRRYQEMHGDGGVMTQVFGFIFLPRLLALSGRSEGRMYLLRNETLAEQWKEVHPTLISLAGRSIGMLLRNQGIGDLYMAYLVAQETGMDFNLAFIPTSFHFGKHKGEFDPVVMTALFDTGFEQARAGTAWKKEPPALPLLKRGATPDNRSRSTPSAREPREPSGESTSNSQVKEKLMRENTMKQ